MTEIPDDIKEAATRVFLELQYETFHDDLDDIEHDELVIARAILAERERCKAVMAETIRLCMLAVADEMRDASPETVEAGCEAFYETTWFGMVPSLQVSCRADMKRAIAAVFNAAVGEDSYRESKPS